METLSGKRVNREEKPNRKKREREKDIARVKKEEKK